VCAKVGHRLAAVLLSLITTISAPASAWVETNAKALVSTVEVERDGKATITHELTLEVRGGPLQKLELATSDTDAEMLPDARATRVSTGQPFPLLVERRADGALGLEIDHERGLRSGTYAFVVRYRTDLRARGLFTERANSVVLGWTGPRLASGVDGVRTLLHLPPGDPAPRLPTLGADDPDPGFGVLVAGVRRTPRGDEVELVRSHVAKGEPVLWRVEASALAFEPLAQALPQKPVATPRIVAGGVTPRSPRWLIFGAIAGLLLAGLVIQKSRGFARKCETLRVSSQPLVRLPLSARAPLAGLSLGSGLYVGAELEEPAIACLCLLAAFAFSALAVPDRGRTPRSPGRWLPLQREDAFRPRASAPAGAWLDSGTLRGFFALLLAFAAVVGIALLELSQSSYRALLILLAGGVLVPIFFTGRASDVVADRVAFSRRFLRRLERRLSQQSRAWKTVPWGRVPDGSADPDELRLLIQPKDAVEGLVAVEAALEPERGLGGFVGAPFVIVRVKEGSRAQLALTHGVIWTRGRKPDERVAILSPKLPTLDLTAGLVERLACLLTDQRPKRAERSTGKPALTSKLGRVVSPAHAT
jgi:hypothetical protein